MWQGGWGGGEAAGPGRRRGGPGRWGSPRRGVGRHRRVRDEDAAMSAIRQTNSKSLMLFSGRAYPELADEIGGHLGVMPTPTASYEFANGELFVRFEESVRGCDAFVVQSHTAPINTWLMEQRIRVDRSSRPSAKRIPVAAPFFPSARKDKKPRAREPISARLVAD